jgi:hypothetical protein
VKFAGRPSWQVRINLAQPLVIALHLRDAAGLDVAADAVVPPLEPAVPLDAALVPYATEQAAAQWTQVWQSLLDGHPEFSDAPSVFAEPLHGLPAALTALAEAGLPNALAWLDACRQEDLQFLRASGGRPGRRMGRGLGITELVRRIEQENGREAVPFTLRISLLPVAGNWARRVRREHVLLSRSICEDEAACEAFLEPVLRDLA